MKFILTTIIVLSSTFFSAKAFSKVEIQSYKKHSWDNSWNHFIIEAIDNDLESVMLTSSIDEKDLLELGCPGFNSADAESKKDFWVVFFSSLTRAESAFNVKVKSIAPKGRHGNYGLLQLSKRTARQHCGLDTPEELISPNEQLRCGVKLLNWQLRGAPAKNGKLLRPDLKDQLFGKYILLWGPLRQNDKHGRELLVTWFKKHSDQMSFCR